MPRPKSGRQPACLTSGDDATTSACVLTLGDDASTSATCGKGPGLAAGCSWFRQPPACASCSPAKACVPGSPSRVVLRAGSGGASGERRLARSLPPGVGVAGGHRLHQTSRTASWAGARRARVHPEPAQQARALVSAAGRPPEEGIQLRAPNYEQSGQRGARQSLQRGMPGWREQEKRPGCCVEARAADHLTSETSSRGWGPSLYPQRTGDPEGFGGEGAEREVSLEWGE